MQKKQTKGTLPFTLIEQLHRFISTQMLRCMAHYNEPRLKKTVQKNFEWVEEFGKLHYESRIMRATDLGSIEVEKAQELSRNYIGAGNHDFFVTCVDGRNMPATMFSKPPHVGGVLRSPAGVVTGFMEGQQPGTVFIDQNSFVVQQIVRLLKQKVGSTIFYGLDSHIGCAARAQIHASEGGQQQDGGVRADIMSKMMIAKGILQLRQQLKNEGADVALIIPTFFSYDPSCGGVIMGLETLVDDEEVAKVGFTKDILGKLASENKIVRTIDLLADKKISSALSSKVIAGSTNFRNKYAESLLSNWKSIVELYNNGEGEIFKIVLEKLTTAYTSSGWLINQSLDSLREHTISERTLKQKAKFMLKNLVTRYAIAGADGKWPYDSHKEEMVVITDGGYAPFSAIDAFAVFSQDLNSLLANTKLPIDLIRNFRRDGKLQDPVKGSFLSTEEFISAPIFISNKGILKDISKESWNALKELNLTHTFETIAWDNADVLEWRKSDIHNLIMGTLHDKKIMINFADALQFIDGVYELFNRLRIMMKDKYFRQMIIHGNIFVLSTLVDHNRMPHLILHLVV